VPIIRHFRQAGHEILIAGEGQSLAFLRDEFPGLQWVELPSFSPRLSKSSSQLFKLFSQLPGFFYKIWSEHRHTAELVKKYGINVIISDNRYGVRNRKCKSILITHQLSPFVGAKSRDFRRSIVSVFLGIMIKPFDACWIPDSREGRSLAGDLAVPMIKLRNTVKIGLLSRFVHDDTYFSPGGGPLAMISGPEPQRTIFEERVIRFFEQRNEEATIIRGLPLHPHKIERRGKIILLSHCNSQEFALLMRSAQYIVCRSGYTTIMDLMVLGRRALLVPTPGQTEQEYLAQRMQMFDFDTVSQDRLLFLDHNLSLSRIKKIYEPWVEFDGSFLLD
jgi:hypothetical protein